MFSLDCNLTKTSVRFLPIEIRSKKVSGNNTDFSTREYISKKVRGKNVDITTSEIMFIKVRGKYVDLWTSAITQKKICGNNVDFSNIEITLKKVRGNDLDFSISKITSKKYVKTTSKFVKICSSMYWRYIHVQSTSIPRGVRVGKYVVCSLVSIYMDSSQLGIQ